jgi:hypothetical protein
MLKLLGIFLYLTIISKNALLCGLVFVGIVTYSLQSIRLNSYKKRHLMFNY